MAEFVVVLVEPKFAGNIGFVARAMANFGLEELVLCNPCELDDDAYRFSKHARYIVENARIFNNLNVAIKDIDLVVGTTGRPTESEKKYLRQPITPKEFVSQVNSKKGRIGLLFGREDYGLYNEELKKCDIVVTIPTSPGVPVMNISHAATIIFYELYTRGKRSAKKSSMNATEKETLNSLFSELLESINYPKHKKAKTKVMIRRIMGRANLSKCEFYTLAGVIRKGARGKIRNKARKIIKKK